MRGQNQHFISAFYLNYFKPEKEKGFLLYKGNTETKETRQAKQSDFYVINQWSQALEKEFHKIETKTGKTFETIINSVNNNKDLSLTPKDRDTLIDFVKILWTRSRIEDNILYEQQREILKDANGVEPTIEEIIRSLGKIFDRKFRPFMSESCIMVYYQNIEAFILSDKIFNRCNAGGKQWCHIPIARNIIAEIVPYELLEKIIPFGPHREALTREVSCKKDLTKLGLIECTSRIIKLNQMTMTRSKYIYGPSEDVLKRVLELGPYEDISYINSEQ